jgi:hypothetical protein
MEQMELIIAWPSSPRLRRPGKRGDSALAGEDPLRERCDLFWVVFRQISGRKGRSLADLPIRVKMFHANHKWTPMDTKMGGRFSPANDANDANGGNTNSEGFSHEFAPDTPEPGTGGLISGQSYSEFMLIRVNSWFSA